MAGIESRDFTQRENKICHIQVWAETKQVLYLSDLMKQTITKKLINLMILVKASYTFRKCTAVAFSSWFLNISTSVTANANDKLSFSHHEHTLLTSGYGIGSPTT